MPHSADASGLVMPIRVSMLRLYLQQSCPTCGEDVIEDAVVHCEPGAVDLVSLLLQLRSNPRTRRTLRTVRMEHLSGLAAPGGWYTRLAEAVYQQYRLWRNAAFPMQPQTPLSIPMNITRESRRRLRWTRAVQAELPTLGEESRVAATELWNALPGQQVVLWVDNWYWERYGTDPVQTNQSLNVSVLAVMLLSQPSATPAQSTRSQRFSPFPGHRSLASLVSSVDWAAAVVVSDMRSLQQKVHGIVHQYPLQPSMVRVPLDIPRQHMVSLPWRGLTLSQLRVSSNEELLRLMVEVRQLQRHVGQCLPLLVDEKIHYTLGRMMYSQSHAARDAISWLAEVPLLYGVWHPYKHTLHVLHRAFFPLFALLESAGSPHIGQVFSCQRKVAYLEKLYAALLLAAPRVRTFLEDRQHSLVLESPHHSCLRVVSGVVFWIIAGHE